MVNSKLSKLKTLAAFNQSSLFQVFQQTYMWGKASLSSSICEGLKNLCTSTMCVKVCTKMRFWRQNMNSFAFYVREVKV